MINENYGIDKRIFTSADAPWICELLKRKMIFVHVHIVYTFIMSVEQALSMRKEMLHLHVHFIYIYIYFFKLIIKFVGPTRGYL
jgi:hypothetical protein